MAKKPTTKDCIKFVCDGLDTINDTMINKNKELAEKNKIERENIDRLVENVENLYSNDLKPMWDKWHEEMTKQIKETLKGEE